MSVELVPCAVILLKDPPFFNSGAAYFLRRSLRPFFPAISPSYSNGCPPARAENRPQGRFNGIIALGRLDRLPAMRQSFSGSRPSSIPAPHTCGVSHAAHSSRPFAPPRQVDTFSAVRTAQHRVLKKIQWMMTSRLHERFGRITWIGLNRLMR